MRRIYTDVHGRCSVTLVRCGDEWEVQNVTTLRLYRRRGLMRALMKRVLDDADREGVVLLLVSGLGREGGMTTEELVEWYSKLGFDAIAPGGYPGTTMMQRVPHPFRLDGVAPCDDAEGLPGRGETGDLPGVRGGVPDDPDRQAGLVLRSGGVQHEAGGGGART